MNYRYWVLLVLTIFHSLAHGTNQSVLRPDQDVLRANHKVMAALMQRLEREADLAVRRTLILDHIPHMETYTRHLVRRYTDSCDPHQRGTLKGLIQSALQQNLSLATSVIPERQLTLSDNSEQVATPAVVEQRLQLLRSMIKQTITLQTILNQPEPPQKAPC